MNHFVICLLITFSSLAHAADVIPVNFDKAWSASIVAVSSKGLPIVTSDKTSGLISTQTIKLPGSFNIPARIKRVAKFTYHVVPFGDARYSLNILIAQNGEGVSVTVTPTIEGLNKEENQWVQFESNGTIEGEILQAIKDNLACQ